MDLTTFIPAEEALGLFKLHNSKGGFPTQLHSVHEHPIHQFVSLVLLQAVQDHATAVSFTLAKQQGDEFQFTVTYVVKGKIYDMAPPPAHLFAAVSAVLLDLAETNPSSGQVLEGKFETLSPDSAWVLTTSDPSSHVCLRTQ